MTDLIAELNKLEGIRCAIGGTPEIGEHYRKECAAFCMLNHAELVAALSTATAPDPAAPDGDGSHVFVGDPNSNGHVHYCLKCGDVEGVETTTDICESEVVHLSEEWNRLELAQMVLQGRKETQRLQALWQQALSNPRVGEAVAWEMRYLPPKQGSAWSRWIPTTPEAFQAKWPYDNAAKTEYRALYTAPPTAIPDGMVVECEWTFDDVMWDTACGQSWQFTTDGPAENNYRFCHGCGKPIVIAAAPGSAEGVDRE